MLCVNGHQIPQAKAMARFCPVCGEPLGGRCANGHEMLPSATVCAQCGQPALDTVASQGFINQASDAQTATGLPPLTPTAPPVRIDMPEPTGEAFPARRRHPAAVPILVASAGIVIAGVIVAIGMSGRHSTPPQSSTSPTGLSSSSNRTPANSSNSGGAAMGNSTNTGNSGSGDSGSGNSGSGNSGSGNSAQSEATALNNLLSSSAQARSGVQAAYNDIDACGPNLQSDYSTLEQAATARQNLLTSLNQLQVSQLPQSQALTEDLTSAWNESITADQAFASWAQDEMSNCTQQDHSDSNWVGGNSASVQADTAKNDFTQLWNTSIAPTYNLTQWQANQI